MFIEGTVIYRKGIEAEHYVWEQVKAVFTERESFGFLHFPMFKKNHTGKREIDILLVDRELGTTVIEVKGINIAQIKGIQGPIWHYSEDYYTSTGDPFNQAEQQLNMLCDDIEKKAILYRTFSKRVVVALPFITSEQWAERGYNQQINSPPILFKDDFEKGNWLKKLEQLAIYKARFPLHDHKWLALKKYFFIKNPVEASTEKANHFSYLFVFTNNNQFEEEKEKIERALREGSKIYIFSSFSLSNDWICDQKKFQEEFQLQIFHSKDWSYSTDKIIIKDGNVDKSFLMETLSPLFPEFNSGQYLAIHTAPSDNLMITAGAGTGKTYVMIDRILYLLEKADITLKDIVMITFTNASTDEMKERLQKRLLTMFRLTGKTKYLNFAEEVKNMQISTIHSFSKSILTQLAHEIGFGRNVKVRSFIKTKSDIIEKLADDFFRNNSVKELVKLELPFYKVVKTIKDFWDEMEKKGLTSKEIELLNWGKVVDNQHQILHDLFRYVFERCEGLLEVEKKKENAIDTGDMIRKLKLFTNNEKMNQLQMNKYLFVDEFQDSDNTQIELVSSLQNQLNYQLFVVGDIKQSIYRFRGADYTSFERLEKKVNSGFIPIALTQNYRTTSSLLLKLDKVFSVWGQKCWGPKSDECLLPYTDVDRLKGMKLTEPNETEFIHPGVKKADIESETISYILSSMSVTERLPEKQNKKIALIVRTNKDALEVRDWCERANIGTSRNLDGTFYKSDAVLHFKMLLDALLYPNEAKFVVNLLQSPYFNYRIPLKLLIKFNGDSEKIIKFLKANMKGDFTNYIEKLRVLPIMAVIQKVISEKGLLNNVKSFYEATIVNKLTIETSISQYEKNLFHLMNLIQQQFDSMNGTLWNIHEWLTLQIRVNRKENEPLVETKPNIIEITTVHRSKGLEYHTVIMPKLNRLFNHGGSSFYIQDEKELVGDERKVGWKFKEKKRTFENNQFGSLQSYESFEVEREETRLLYVAMTRSKKRLILLMPKRTSENSWARILEKGLNEVKHES